MTDVEIIDLTPEN